MAAANGVTFPPYLLRRRAPIRSASAHRRSPAPARGTAMFGQENQRAAMSLVHQRRPTRLTAATAIATAGPAPIGHGAAPKPCSLANRFFRMSQPAPSSNVAKDQRHARQKRKGREAVERTAAEVAAVHLEAPG